LKTIGRDCFTLKKGEYSNATTYIETVYRACMVRAEQD
jgi:hypothetical protein